MLQYDAISSTCKKMLCKYNETLIGPRDTWKLNRITSSFGDIMNNTLYSLMWQIKKKVFQIVYCSQWHALDINTLDDHVGYYFWRVFKNRVTHFPCTMLLKQFNWNSFVLSSHVNLICGRYEKTKTITSTGIVKIVCFKFSKHIYS